MNLRVNKNGYIRVYIYNKTFALHMLIALTFLDNPENKEQVNHKHENKLNNNISNLEFVTNKENQIHKMGLGNNHTRKIYGLNFYDMINHWWGQVDLKSFLANMNARTHTKLQYYDINMLGLGKLIDVESRDILTRLLKLAIKWDQWDKETMKKITAQTINIAGLEIPQSKICNRNTSRRCLLVYKP